MKVVSTALLAGFLAGSQAPQLFAADEVVPGKTAVKINVDVQTPAEQKAVLISSNKLLGATLVNSQGESVGAVDSILMDRQGTATYVIGGVGGVAGVGRTMIAIPASAVKLQKSQADSSSEWRVQVPMSQDQLAKAPPVTTTTYREFQDDAWLKANSEYFKVDAPVEKFSANQMVCLRRVTDADVKGSGNESVGHLDAVLLNSATLQGQIAIVGDGGTLGVGEKYFALPFDRLRFAPGEDNNILVSVSASKPAVHAAPQVTPETYPELHDQTVRSRIEEFEGAREARKPVLP